METNIKTEYYNTSTCSDKKKKNQGNKFISNSK